MTVLNDIQVSNMLSIKSRFDSAMNKSLYICVISLKSEANQSTHLSFSMNLMKSLFGGLGMRLRQLHNESSSDPNPL